MTKLDQQNVGRPAISVLFWGEIRHQSELWWLGGGAALARSLRHASTACADRHDLYLVDNKAGNKAGNKEQGTRLLTTGRHWRYCTASSRDNRLAAGHL
jgi:hypothetical protein